MRWGVAFALIILAATAAHAEIPPPPAAFVSISPSGHIVTRKTIAECKRQARVRKLNYIRQRDFVRRCIAA